MAKSRPTAMNLSSSVPASYSSAKNPIRSSDRVKLMAGGKLASRTRRRNSKPNEASSSQVKLKDENLGGLMDESVEKLVATEENQVLWEFSESESWSIHENEVTGKLVAYKKKARRNLRLPVFQKNQGILKLKERNGHIISTYPSSAVVSHMDKVYSIVRKTYGRGPMDEMDDPNGNAAIW